MPRLRIASTAVWLGLVAVSWAASAGEVVIHRDAWGVPHIEADSLPEAAYGIGYAQAEDRLPDIHQAVRVATGRMSETAGADYKQSDFGMLLMRNRDGVRAWWESAPAYVRALGEQYVAGVNAFQAKHPDKVPAFAVELKPWHVASVGRAMLLRWPLGNVYDDLSRAQDPDKEPEDPGRGSNGWAVAPSRSAEDCAILLTDPHLTWEGLAVFWEARVHTPEVDWSAFFLTGAPLPVLGHNAHVGWACTTGGPDTGDVYAVPLNPDNPLQYRYDGEWRLAKTGQMRVNVKDSPPAFRPRVETVHGPVLLADFERDLAFAAATPYYDAFGGVEQLYAMALARNADELRQALSMNQLMEQNILFADRQGNIGYVRTGRTPIRPEGYDWDRPVPGDTPATRHLGVHPQDDLVQIMNPPQGYLQNCNISPAQMMADSPLTPDAYRDYIYNVTWDSNNPRGQRALDVLSADDSLTKEEAKALAMDVYDRLAPRWQAALRAALEEQGEPSAEVQEAAEALLAWDGELTKDSEAAALAQAWRGNCPEAIWAAMAEGRELTREQQAALLEALTEGVGVLEAEYGSWRIPWGEIRQIGRGGVYAPIGSANYGKGPRMARVQPLFSISTLESDDPDLPPRLAYKGSMSMMLMFFHEDGVESYSAMMWGQSQDPASEHYMDQGAQLFSGRQFKPTWFDLEAARERMVSSKTLSTGDE